MSVHCSIRKAKSSEVLHAMKMGMVVRSPSFFDFLPFILALPIQSSGLSTVDLEAEALLNWKTSLKNHTLVSWFLRTSNSTNHCSWIGIKCNDGRNVIEINLSNFYFEGTLNQLNFFSLPHLTGLNLSMNHLEGKIPKSIGSLSKLGFLDLGDNQFMGSVPEEIGNLTELRFISLSGNDLSGPIPYQLGNLQKISQPLFPGAKN
ncbi:MDIS1-interacting receptor like kinase 2-like [Amborella trichopoda]|uniref:MDIS1-interacting receptor like kinase 2-like n=1 Tax=Amborella trichopoda TaxID=13333 RepID=UPI0009BFDB1C|nr:MDIS1-interacting receptor like kinase 2-like [Amborella trichopoda]|eukprot:XP_020517560.1 MDIS1-interacting receptor like kinase 2-like [Amborella trichopoda]